MHAFERITKKKIGTKPDGALRLTRLLQPGVLDDFSDGLRTG